LDIGHSLVIGHWRLVIGLPGSSKGAPPHEVR
jgi:hypothetical protein